jgi:RND family efflux transporter MFP subunit
VQQARVSAEKSSRDLQRAKNLYADTVTTLEQVQNATSGLDLAKANLQAAEFNLRFASIVAPVNGQILKRLSEPNEIIGSGYPVFLLGSADEAWVITVGLSDKDVIRIQENDKASISLDAYPNEVFEAFVSQIDQTSNRGSGTYEVKLQINPRGKRMVSGFIAKGQILPKNQQNPLVIPIEALSEADGNTAYVFLLNADNQTVKKIKIGIADIYENQVAVSEGLEENQTVIVAGVAYLSSESKVRVAGTVDK